MVCWRFVPISLTVASLSLLICRITNSAMAQVMLLFLLAVLQGFITGCFVPKLLLPEILERVAVYTPAYYMIELMSGLYTESETLTAVAVLLGFTLVFLLFGAVCNRRERVA
jgi:ABC-type multidrug transport system permease subunit